MSEAVIKELRAKLAEQDEFIKAVSAAAVSPGTVVAVDEKEKKMQVAMQGALMEISLYKGVGVGTQVLIHPQSRQAVGVSLFSTRFGSPVTVTGILPDGRIEVMHGGENRIVFASRTLPDQRPPNGTTGLLDSTGTVLMDIISPPKAETNTYTRVHWDEIGGNVRAKRELKEAVDMIRGGPEVFKAYQAKPPKGVLLYGPPGCGKTMLGKAVATELNSDGFIYVKAPELLNRYVGATEERIRAIFNSARTHKVRTGQTAVVFIDEADAILQRRGSGVSSNMEKTIVPSFLTEMDGLDESSAMVILATNRADTLDPAVTREGRIDIRILIDRPDPKDFATIVRGYLKGLPLAADAEKMAIDIAACVFENPKLRDRVSGAMAATLVANAKKVAIRRDVAKKKVTGITMDDIHVAMNEGE